MSDERALIERAIQGDVGAARELYDRHVGHVHRLVSRLLGPEDAADDCTQETFARAFRRLAGFRGGAAFSTWLRRIAVSAVVDRQRSTRRFRTRETSLEAAAGVAVEPEGPRWDLRRRLEAAVDALAAPNRMVFVLYDVEGYTHAEIGELLGIPVGTSKRRLSDARAALRTALADFAGEWEG
ncbi:MAG TPA: RNA polymerase sigma factor [Longimicrobium sp.]|jgi:RNA polymerase sigma-70 factor (ECF subfamily)